MESCLPQPIASREYWKYSNYLKSSLAVLGAMCGVDVADVARDSELRPVHGELKDCRDIRKLIGVAGSSEAGRRCHVLTAEVIHG